MPTANDPADAVREALARFGDLIGAHGDHLDAAALKLLEDRLAALAGAAPVDKAEEERDMAALDKYAEVALALGFEGDAWFGDPLASHAEIVARAKSREVRMDRNRVIQEANLRASIYSLYAAASKGFHTSETCGPDGKYLRVSKFQSMADLHVYEDAWRNAMIAARDGQAIPHAPAKAREDELRERLAALPRYYRESTGEFIRADDIDAALATFAEGE